MGAYSRGALFVKISFRGGGLFESGGVIDHLRYSKVCSKRLGTKFVDHMETIPLIIKLGLY